MSQLALPYLQLLDLGFISVGDTVELIKSESKITESMQMIHQARHSSFVLKDDSVDFLNPQLS